MLDKNLKLKISCVNTFTKFHLYSEMLRIDENCNVCKKGFLSKKTVINFHFRSFSTYSKNEKRIF